MKNLYNQLSANVTKLILILGTCFLIVSTNASTPPVPLPDDNGDLAFVKQVLPKLLGRKPKGMLEVKLLADLADLHGREALVSALMEMPEFNEHWSALIVDQLKVKRDSIGELPASCFNSPMLNPLLVEASKSGGKSSSSLAEFILSQDIVSSYAQTFNLYDVIKSSISIDNLMPVYRSYFFAMAAHPPGGSMLSEEERRAELAKFFNDTYLNRDKECMACHNTTYSTTGIGDRTHPLYASLDLSLFDPSGGSFSTAIDNANYTNSCAGCHGGQATGAGNTPGILGASASEIKDAIANYPAMNHLNVLSNGTIDDISAALAVGPFSGNNIAATNELNNAFFRTDFFETEDPDSGWGPWGMTTDCASINGTPSQGAIPGFFAGVSSNYLSPVDIDTQFVNGAQHLAGSLNLLTQLDENGDFDGDLAYAYRVAATITANVWEQFMGERLSIANQYARNASQRNLLAYLTEEHFIAHNWSLKKVILAITGSKFYNRRAPINSVAAHPYELQAVFEPFVPAEGCRVNYHKEDDTREPIDDFKFASIGGGNPSDKLVSTTQAKRSAGAGSHQLDLDFIDNKPCFYNGQGDIVHRFAPRTLLNSVALALDWPKPQLKPGNAYPSENLMKAIGQYWSSLEIGDKDVGFQSLLNWDEAFGRCPKKGDDWIESLKAAIDEFNLDNPLDPLTLEDVVLTMKDWLIQEPGFGGVEIAHEPTRGPVFANASSIQPTEQSLVKTFFSMPLDTPVDSDLSSQKLRELCGVYLKTPQFMMSGIVRNDNFKQPRLRVCNSGSCTYKEMCQPISNKLNILGFKTKCNNTSVGKPFGLTFKNKSP